MSDLEFEDCSFEVSDDLSLNQRRNESMKNGKKQNGEFLFSVTEFDERYAVSRNFSVSIFFSSGLSGFNLFLSRPFSGTRPS